MLILNGYGDIGLLVLRIVIGLIFVYHGFPKLSNATKSGGGMGVPVWFAFVIGILEVLGGVGLLLGLYTQIAAIFVIMPMVGAIYKKIFVWKIAFYARDTAGWEFDLILLASAIALLLVGPGGISVDSLIGLYP